MVKDNKTLFSEFKNLEAELIDILKINQGGIAAELSDDASKTEIKKYISKVNKAKKIFEKYEALSIEIEKRINEKRQRAESKLKIEAETTDESKAKYVDELVVDGKQAKVVKRKKKTSQKEY